MYRVSSDVRVLGSGQVDRREPLPAVPDAEPFNPSIVDHLGAAVRTGSDVVLSLLGSPRGRFASETPQPRLDELYRTEHTTQDGRPVKVMSLNIRGGLGPANRGTFSQPQIEAIVAAIRRENPDIVMLQEVDDFAVRSRLKDQIRILSRQLGATSAAAAPSSQRINGRRQNVAVLTFHGFKVDGAQNLMAPDTNGEGILRRLTAATGSVLKRLHLPEPDGPRWRSYSPRNTLDTFVRTPEGRALRVLSTHLSGNIHGADQEGELRPLAGSLDAWKGPTIIGGDFNILGDSPQGAFERTLMRRAGLTDTFTSAGIPLGDPRRLTFVGKESRGDIDRIYASDHFAVQGVRVLNTGLSDHRAVVTELTVR